MCANAQVVLHLSAERNGSKQVWVLEKVSIPMGCNSGFLKQSRSNGQLFSFSCLGKGGAIMIIFLSTTSQEINDSATVTNDV